MKKRFFKKNQIIITALAVLIAIAGYINYADSTMNRETESTGAAAEAGDESTAVLDENTILQDIESLDQDLTDETADAGETASAEETVQAAGEDAGEVQTESQTSSGDGTEGENAGENGEETASDTPGEAVLTTASTYMAQARIDREQMRSQTKESLLGIINNENLSDEERQNAVQSMVELTDAIEKEAAAELLLEARGFDSVVVNLTGETADVLVPSAELGDEQRAQIEDIVTRKTGVEIQNIVITPMGEE